MRTARRLMSPTARGSSAPAWPADGRLVARRHAWADSLFGRVRDRGRWRVSFPMIIAVAPTGAAAPARPFVLRVFAGEVDPTGPSYGGAAAPGPGAAQRDVATYPPPLGKDRSSRSSGRSGRGDLTHDQVIELYTIHHDALVRFASLVAPENGMAEDLVQEAFVRLYKSWRGIREPDKVPAYLRSTIANLARGRGRRMSTAQRNRPAPAPDAASAEEGALALENRSEVVGMLRRLPPRQRECLVLRYYEGQTESQIAATLGISIGSVRQHTARGMAALQRHYGVDPTNAAAGSAGVAS